MNNYAARTAERDDRSRHSPSGKAKSLKIRFGAAMEDAWDGYDTYLRNLAARPGVKRVCEIGGGANPALPVDFVERNELEYVILDISAEELAKAPDEYSKVQADITSPDLDIPGGYDLVFSKMVAEHVRNGREFHNNVMNLLAEGGTAFHFFPTLYTPPFVVNRLMPQWLSEFVLLAVQPNRKRGGRHAKFPAYYSWCRGPSSSQIKKFESLGYKIEEYVGFFGHEYYKKIKPLHEAHVHISSALIRHPLPWLASFAYVVMTRKSSRR